MRGSGVLASLVPDCARIEPNPETAPSRRVGPRAPLSAMSDSEVEWFPTSLVATSAHLAKHARSPKRNSNGQASMTKAFARPADRRAAPDSHRWSSPRVRLRGRRLRGLGRMQLTSVCGALRPMTARDSRRA